MDKENNFKATKEKENIHISINYGYKPLKECMKNIITRRISQYNK